MTVSDSEARARNFTPAYTKSDTYIYLLFAGFLQLELSDVMT